MLPSAPSTFVQMYLPVVPGPALVVGPVFVAFEVQGVPGYKARHRSRIVFPRAGKPFIHNYSDPETAAYEKTIAQIGRVVMRGRAPSERPIALLVHAFKPVPKSWSNKDRELALAGGIRPTVKPDEDNYLKIRDALNEIVWKDDSQVVDGRAIKLYSARPALRIEVREFLEPR